jgi:hypothetical protein
VAAQDGVGATSNRGSAPESGIAAMLGLSSTATEVLVIGLAVWLTVAITLAVLMGRRGHSPFEWFLIGAVLGPIALPIAWGRIKDEPTAPDREVVDVSPGPGAGPSMSSSGSMAPWSRRQRSGQPSRSSGRGSVD